MWRTRWVKSNRGRYLKRDARIKSLKAHEILKLVYITAAGALSLNLRAWTWCSRVHEYGICSFLGSEATGVIKFLATPIRSSNTQRAQVENGISAATYLPIFPFTLVPAVYKAAFAVGMLQVHVL